MLQFKYIEEFINRIDVECPECSSKSLVISNPDNRFDTKFVCKACGKFKRWEGNPNSYYYGKCNKESDGITIGQPVDCYFKMKLWYQSNFKDEVLFAYNLEHLSFLNYYITDKIRERVQLNEQWSNASLQSRLPKWMLSRNNRVQLIKKINELKLK